MNEKRKTSKKIYSCSFMNLYEDEVVLPNEQITQRVYIKHPGAAAILPIAKDGRVILTRQFRYPIQMTSLEIPAGKKDDIDEDPMICAIRELEEETGFVSHHVIHLYKTYPCLGYSDEIVDIYLALDCEPIENPKPQDPDEFVETEFYTCEELKTMLENKTIHDAKTIIALQSYFLFYKK